MQIDAIEGISLSHAFAARCVFSLGGRGWLPGGLDRKEELDIPGARGVNELHKVLGNVGRGGNGNALGLSAGNNGAVRILLPRHYDDSEAERRAKEEAAARRALLRQGRGDSTVMRRKLAAKKRLERLAMNESKEGGGVVAVV